MPLSLELWLFRVPRTRIKNLGEAIVLRLHRKKCLLSLREAFFHIEFRRLGRNQTSSRGLLTTSPRRVTQAPVANEKSKKSDSYFVITYRDPREGSIVTLKARTIRDSTLGLSFISISDFIFETDGIVVNPTEEQLRVRFENVRSFHLSIYSIISIEEVGM